MLRGALCLARRVVPLRSPRHSRLSAVAAGGSLPASPRSGLRWGLEVVGRHHVVGGDAWMACSTARPLRQFLTVGCSEKGPSRARRWAVGACGGNHPQPWRARPLVALAKPHGAPFAMRAALQANPRAATGRPPTKPRRRPHDAALPAPAGSPAAGRRLCHGCAGKGERALGLQALANLKPCAGGRPGASSACPVVF